MPLVWHDPDLAKRRLQQRRNWRLYKQRRRRVWRAKGLCVECGETRDSTFLRCGLCRIGNLIRFERAYYKRRGLSYG